MPAVCHNFDHSTLLTVQYLPSNKNKPLPPQANTRTMPSPAWWMEINSIEMIGLNAFSQQ